jgi:hypothetical protein
MDWHKYVHHYANGSINWHQYASERNLTEQEMQRLPGNFTGDASDATTEDELDIWRERARIQVRNFVPTSFQNESYSDVDAEYQRNLDRINHPAAATEAPAAATEAPAAATEAPAAVTEVPAVVPEAPVATTAAPTAPPTTQAPTTHTTTWWLLAAAPMEMPAAIKTSTANLSESPFKQASPMLLMFALLAGIAMSAIAVGRRQRRAGSASEPLLTEHTVMP